MRKSFGCNVRMYVVSLKNISNLRDFSLSLAVRLVGLGTMELLLLGRGPLFGSVDDTSTK